MYSMRFKKHEYIPGVHDVCSAPWHSKLIKQLTQGKIAEYMSDEHRQSLASMGLSIQMYMFFYKALKDIYVDKSLFFKLASNRLVLTYM